jgi:hypothetical protein
MLLAAGRGQGIQVIVRDVAPEQRPRAVQGLPVSRDHGRAMEHPQVAVVTGLEAGLNRNAREHEENEVRRDRD